MYRFSAISVYETDFIPRLLRVSVGFDQWGYSSLILRALPSANRNSPAAHKASAPPEFLFRLTNTFRIKSPPSYGLMRFFVLPGGK
jgi:hypothetical protein